MRDLIALLAIALTCSCVGEIEDGLPDVDEPQSDPMAPPPSMGGRESIIPPPPSGGCGAAPIAPSSPRLWLLDDGQYGSTIATVLSGRRSATGNLDLAPPTGVPLPLTFAPESEQTFSTLAERRLASVDDAADVSASARNVADRLLADPAVAPCLGTTASLRECLERPLLGKAELLFRRPVAAADVASYLELASNLESTMGRRQAARVAFEAMLVSPRFLFRSEVGTAQAGRVRLDPYEIADALSYSLTDGPPDQALWTDATSGALTDRAIVGRHVTRLLAAADRSGPVRKFLRELTSYTEALGVEKENAKFHAPGDLVKDADVFIENLLRTNGHKNFLQELLAGRHGYARYSTRTNYGELVGNTTTSIPDIVGSAPKAVAFKGERQGILGHPAWLSGFAQPERTDPVMRGRFVYERLLCGEVPSPPKELIIPEPPTDPKLQQREKLAVSHSPAVCRTCHQLMDGIGLALEGFDLVGRSRTMEAGRPVDRSAHLVGSDDQDGPFDGLDGLVTKLVASKHVASCFTAHAFQFFMGRTARPADACSIEDSRRRYQEAGGDLAAMVQGFFSSDGFLGRQR